MMVIAHTGTRVEFGTGTTAVHTAVYKDGTLYYTAVNPVPKNAMYTPGPPCITGTAAQAGGTFGIFA